MFCTGEPYCNCQDCYWANNSEEVCSCCGCLTSSCPVSMSQEERDNDVDPEEDERYHDLHQVWLESFEYSELSQNEEGDTI